MPIEHRQIAKSPDRQMALFAMARDIKLSHSVFALPFALLATFLAAGAFPGWIRLILIFLCMGFARTFAMLSNRYLDREIDKRNPRTQSRALPSGRITPRDAVVAMLFCAAGLVAGAAMFGFLDRNWWPAILSPLVLGWLYAYGLMKRWTALCHFFLGAALAISPLAAALAIQPASLQQPQLWYLAGFVLLWVAGFDVIYAIQDVDVDRREKLHSIPAALGKRGALLAAGLIHVAGFFTLIAAHTHSNTLGPWFAVGVLLVGVLLIVEHVAAACGRFSMAFFTLNGVISLLLGGLGITDVMIQA